ncbi:MAG: HPr family phosphocarrier protein [Proteobacteria bacterium]|nr:HPr family phosphocarrier protein [Pseudomonadota bacterium]MBU0968156.1 HPr family phosphocarrier protein [Pseudomonadota bacterium]
MPECRKELVIANTFGLHGRASAMLVETAKQFDSDIRLIRDGVEADCKSILDVMSMACTKGTPVSIKAAGEDAEAALVALARLIADKFGEE